MTKPWSYLKRPNSNPVIVTRRWGDGICDEYANTKILDYDGGDCCLPSATKQKFHGHHDYQMIVDEIYSEDFDKESSNLKCHINQEPVYKTYDFENIACSYVYSNGFCDDFANNEGCHWDGGDCCLNKINGKDCEDCICHYDKTRHISYKDIGIKAGKN